MIVKVFGVAVIAAAIGFFVGRAAAGTAAGTASAAGSAAATGSASATGSAAAAAAAAAAGSAPASASPLAAGSAAAAGTETRTGSGSGETCASQLASAEARLLDLEQKRRALDGDPIPSRSDVAARFQDKPLIDAVQSAFRLTKIAGRVDTVDCGEFPCILYGRVNGDEELVAKLEDSKPFAAYDNDIGVMLTWASGDHARGAEPKVSHDRAKPSEISLFAFAFYTAADKAKYGDALDRRIRSRTADLWNALSPDEP